MALESVELMKSILDTNWNRANTGQRKPVIMDITTLDPGRGKRFDLSGVTASSSMRQRITRSSLRSSMTSSILALTSLSTLGLSEAESNS